MFLMNNVMERIQNMVVHKFLGKRRKLIAQQLKDYYFSL